MKQSIPDSETIEVIVTKQMTFGEYMKVNDALKKKGWNVKAFQLGVHSFGTHKRKYNGTDQKTIIF